MVTSSCWGKHPAFEKERVCFAAWTTVWVDVAVTDDVEVECMVMNLGCWYSCLTSTSLSLPLQFPFWKNEKCIIQLFITISC